MSKSSNSSRTSSPRAMPVETIITRFKSAQQKRQLREMDRSMTKVTELLKNPVKPKIKKKEPHRKEQRLTSIIPLKDEEGKRSKKNKGKSEKEEDKEFSPMKLKRHVLNKVRLKPKRDLKIIASTNKRKRSVPQKGTSPEDNADLTDVTVSRDTSPKAKRLRPHQDMTMEEMIQLIEDSGSLNDEDLLEILTCPSPVWWEDPPDGYIEDALFTRPRSAAEMYPSIRSQLQEDLQERQRSSTPNVLSRRERVDRKSVPNKIEVTKKQEKEEESSSNNNNSNNDIDLEITLTTRDEKFIKKRSKLESVLGNLKNKTGNDSISKVAKVEVVDGINSDNWSNKVSVIKNLSSKEVKVDGKSFLISGLSDNQVPDKAQVDIDKEKQAPVPMATDHETDDGHLTDLSFQEDFLNDLENMNIPMEDTTDLAQKKEEVKQKSTGKTETLIVLPVFKKKLEIFREPDNEYNRVDCTITNCSLNKCNAINFKNYPIDPTYSDKKSSIIEDYFEMNFFEEEDTVVNKKQNEYSKCGFKSIPTTPSKCKNGKQKENNLNSSVIKFKNSDNTCINVFKIESVVPKNLPPLKNSGTRKSNVGCMPENLPPLRRNPGIIHLNSVSPKSCKSITSFDSNSSVLQDNMDSISDTNICFLNEDDDDFCDEKKTDELQETVIKTSNIRKNKSLNFIHTPNNEFLKKCNGDVLPTELRFTEDEVLYRNFTNINDVISNNCNELEVQSLTITKINDNCCCKIEKKLDAVIIKKDVINCEKEKKKKRTTNRKTDLTVKPKKSESSTLIHNEIGKIENDNSECITVYKIISDDSGNDEPKTEPYIKSPKDITKDLKYTTNESIEKPDSDRDKMNFYFKKCKNLYWKHKIPGKIDKTKQDKKVVNEKDRTVIKHNKDTTVNIKNIKVTDTGRSDKEIKESRNEESNVNYNIKTDKTNIEQYKKDTTDTLKNIKLTNTGSTERKKIKKIVNRESNVDYKNKTDGTNMKQHYKDTTGNVKPIKVTNTDSSEEKEIKKIENGESTIDYNNKTDRTNIKQYYKATTDNVKNIKITNTSSAEENEIKKIGNGESNVDYNNKTDTTNIKQYYKDTTDIKVTNTDSSEEKEIKKIENGVSTVYYNNKTDRTNIKQYSKGTTDNVKKKEEKELKEFGNGEGNVDYNNKTDRTNMKQYCKDTIDNVKNIKVSNTDNSEDKEIKKNENGESNMDYNNKTDRTHIKQYYTDTTDNVKNIKIINTGSSEKEIKKSENVESNVNHNNNLTTDSKEQKCIIVSNTNQIRYCMKCSSIFDTAQCNYCYRKNSTDNKNLATDYLLKMQQCFVCNICRYKALSKDSLERHIMSRCCDSKHR